MKIPPEFYAEIAGLPGEELVVPGLRDLEAGTLSSVEALLLQLAPTRLGAAGVPIIADIEPPSTDVESLLYQALIDEDPPSAYQRYNSLKRRLDRFIRGLEQRRNRLEGVA